MRTGQPARNLNTILFWCANICFVLFVLIFSSVMFYLVTFLYANESSDFVFFLTLSYMLVTVFFTMAFCSYEICLQDLIPDVLCYCNREKSTKRTEKLTTCNINPYFRKSTASEVNLQGELRISKKHRVSIKFFVDLQYKTFS